MPPPLVDAAPVAAHAIHLMEQGMGLQRIAEKAGVAASAIGNVVYGRGGKDARPAKRLRSTTAEKVLAVELDLADGAKVDGTEAHKIVDELLARGWWKAEIGRRVHGPGSRTLQLRGGDVFAGTLRTLRNLLVEPVPMRRHNATGKMYDPTTDHEPRLIPATTPGVPVPREQLLAWDRVRLWQAVEAARQRQGGIYA